MAGYKGQPEVTGDGRYVIVTADLGEGFLAAVERLKTAIGDIERAANGCPKALRYLAAGGLMRDLAGVAEDAEAHAIDAVDAPLGLLRERQDAAKRIIAEIIARKLTTKEGK